MTIIGTFESRAQHLYLSGHLEAIPNYFALTEEALGIPHSALSDFSLQMLMQDAKYHTRFRNTVDALYQLRVYGPGEYYRGLSAILLRNCPGNVVFFTYREKIKNSLPESWRSRYITRLCRFVAATQTCHPYRNTFD